MRKRIGLPLLDWPAADRSAWERANTAVDAFDDGARAAAWQPESRRQAQAAYGRWLAFVLTEWPAARSETPGARLTEARARRYVRRSKRASLP